MLREVTRARTWQVGDFGAAYNYEPLGPQSAAHIERLEVRAFGCMAEELLAHLADEAGSASGAPAAGGADEEQEVLAFRFGVGRLVMRCLAADVLTRPAFTEIVELLAEC